MCVCACVCVCVCVCREAFTYTCLLKRPHINIQKYIHRCPLYMHIHSNTSSPLPIYIYIYIYMSLFIYIYIHICICVCVCVRVCVCIRVIIGTFFENGLLLNFSRKSMSRWIIFSSIFAQVFQKHQATIKFTEQFIQNKQQRKYKITCSFKIIPNSTIFDDWQSIVYSSCSLITSFSPQVFFSMGPYRYFNLFFNHMAF